ncbi:hypothetical protein OKW43_000868 [Paraburkholderia sp. WC7.3g]
MFDCTPKRRHVLAQPPTNDSARGATRDDAATVKRSKPETSKVTLNVVKGVFADAQDAVITGYGTVSAVRP